MLMPDARDDVPGGVVVGLEARRRRRAGQSRVAEQLIFTKRFPISPVSRPKGHAPLPALSSMAGRTGFKAKNRATSHA